MAFARCKMWWAKMNTVELARGPLEGKEHRTPEHYFADVLEGSRSVGKSLFSNEYIRIVFALYDETKLVCNIMLDIF